MMFYQALQEYRVPSVSAHLSPVSIIGKCRCVSLSLFINHFNDWNCTIHQHTRSSYLAPPPFPLRLLPADELLTFRGWWTRNTVKSWKNSTTGSFSRIALRVYVTHCFVLQFHWFFVASNTISFVLSISLGGIRRSLEEWIPTTSRCLVLFVRRVRTRSAQCPFLSARLTPAWCILRRVHSATANNLSFADLWQRVRRPSGTLVIRPGSLNSLVKCLVDAVEACNWRKVLQVTWAPPS